MRGLLKAGLLLAPALTAAFVIPPPPDAEARNDEHHVPDEVDTAGPGELEKWNGQGQPGAAVQGPSSVSIDVDIPGLPESHKDLNLLFNIDVQKSEDICGEGKVLVNGELLAQEPHDGKFSGHGPLAVGDHTILASWDFECISFFDDEPKSQFLTFAIDTVDELEATDNTGFTVWFKQHTEEPSILSTSASTLVKAPKIGKPQNCHQAQADHHELEFDIDEEIADLEWMEHQLRELKWQIAEKKHVIHGLFQAKIDEELAQCDSIKCIARGMFRKAQGMAHRVYSTLKHGKDHHRESHSSEENHKGHKEHIGHKSHREHKEHKSHKQHKEHGNDVSAHGEHAHNNGSHPHPPKHGNHSVPHPPHFRQPHRLPICHYPPPPHHGQQHGPPHGPPGAFDKKPHHGPPHSMDEEEHHHHRPGHSEDGPDYDMSRSGRPGSFGEEKHHDHPHEQDHHHPPPKFDGQAHPEGGKHGEHDEHSHPHPEGDELHGDDESHHEDGHPHPPPPEFEGEAHTDGEHPRPHHGGPPHSEDEEHSHPSLSEDGARHGDDHPHPPHPDFDGEAHPESEDRPHPPHHDGPPHLEHDEPRPHSEDEEHPQPPHNDGPSHPEHDEHSRPPHPEDEEHPHPPHHDGPPHPEHEESRPHPEEEEHPQPPHHDGPPHPEHDEHPPHIEGGEHPHPPHHEGPPHELEHPSEGPHHTGPHGEEHEAGEGPFHSHHGHGGPRGGGDRAMAPPLRFRFFHIAKFAAIGAFGAMLVAALHRRCCNASRRAAKQARREARHRRRAQRHAAHKQAWMTWASKWCRYIPAPTGESADDYEKRAMLADDSEGEMVSEIRQFKNAASIVGDIVAAEEGRTTGRSSIDTTLPDYLSDAGDSLPSYDDTENEVSSMVSDGFRPAGYTPSTSDAGSVRAVIGDVKE